MTSLFDYAGPASGLPAGFVSELMARGSRNVSALSFLAVDMDAADSGKGSSAASVEPDAVAVDDRDDRAQQVAAMIEAAREDAAAQVRREMEAQCEAQRAGERARAERLTVEFARDRRRYFAAAEAQVVKLALAVAERILSQKIVMDEVPLEATIRAALARVQDSSATTLRVHPEQAERWREVFADEPRIAVTEEARIRVEDCVLETRIGEIELGIPAQLAEIRRGFEDLMTRTGD